jgi:hypothetical protein
VSYQQSSQGQQFTPAHGGFPPPEPPKRKRRWPWIAGGIVLVMALGCVGAFTLLGAGAKVVSDATGEMDANQKGTNAAAGQMGKPAKDGKFEFTVTGMKCGLGQVGGEFGSKAQGEFCVVAVTIKNVADTAEPFADSSQQATDDAGKTYDVDSAASMSANGNGSTLFENINPGNKVNGKLAFDVPKGTKLTSIVLHESMFTAGVKIPWK